MITDTLRAGLISLGSGYKGRLSAGGVCNATCILVEDD